MLRVFLIALLALAVAPAGTAAAAEQEAEAVPDVLGGFDDEAEEDYGFGDDDDDHDEDEDDYGFEDDAGDEALGEADSDEDPAAEPFYELSGDLSVGASYNYRNHNAADGTNYGNLSRLRSQLDLQLDLRLPQGWKARVEGYGFYDWAYLFKGRNQFTSEVLDDYEWEVDFKEFYVQGNLTRELDLKLGRQIVNWGRSDTVRVLDVLNPIDNREPGLVDIEDLRLPVTMARLDYYPSWVPSDWGDWSLQLLIVPEFRQDRDPAFGNDFNPSPIDFDVPSNKPDRFFDDPEYGAALSATFSGWDVSLYGARIYLNRPVLEDPLGGATQRVPYVTMAGAGGNLTFGSWLVKGEIGWFHGLEFNQVNGVSLGPGGLLVDGQVVDKDRLDTMVGVEYYGVSDLSVAVEIVHRHIFDFDSRMRARVPDQIGGIPLPPDAQGVSIAYAKEDTVEGAFRATWDLLNQTLHLTGVALLLGKEADLGSVIRAEAAYDVMDALVVTGGIVLYQEGDNPGFEAIGDNDRLFLRVEYAF